MGYCEANTIQNDRTLYKTTIHHTKLPDIIQNFIGREELLLQELHKKYNMHDDHVGLLGHESDKSSSSPEAAVTYNSSGKIQKKKR